MLPQYLSLCVAVIHIIKYGTRFLISPHRLSRLKAAAAAMDIEALLPAALSEEGLTGSVLEELAYNIDQQNAKVRQQIMLMCQRYFSQPEPKADPQVDTALEYLASYSQSEELQQLASYARQFRESKQRADSLSSELNTARAAAELETQARDIQASLLAGELTDAAYSVLQLQKVVQDDCDGQGASFEQLRAAWQGCRDQLDQAVAASLAQLVSYGPQAGQLSLHSGASSQLWPAMELLGSAGKHLQQLADVLTQQVLPPLMAGSHELHVSAAAGGAGADLQLLPAQQHSPEAGLKALLEALSSVLFGGSHTPAGALGALLWGPLAALYQQQRLPALVAAALGPEQLQAVLAAVRDLEAAAASLGFTAHVAEGQALSRALAGVIRQAQQAQQQRHLLAARAAVAAYASGQHESLVVGQPLALDVQMYRQAKSGALQEWEANDPCCGLDTAGPALAKGHYRVSKPAADVAQILQDLVAEAAASGSRATAQALCSAVGSVCALLRHLPMQLAPEVLAAPQLALTYHNDLQHVADLLLLLPFAHGQQLQGLLGAGEPSFMEEVALLRAAAAEVMAAQLQQQEQQFGELLALLRGLGAVRGDGQKGLQQRKVVHQVLHSLERLGRVVHGTLPPAEAADLVAAVLGRVGDALVAEVLARRDIGVDDCQEILALLRPLADDALKRLMATSGRGAAAAAAAAEQDDGGQAEALAYVMRQQVLGSALGFRRLKVVLKMLDARMQEIVDKWESGFLRKHGLAQPEVEQLLCALFEDTQLRAHALQRIRTLPEPSAT